MKVNFKPKVDDEITIEEVEVCNGIEAFIAANRENDTDQKLVISLFKTNDDDSRIVEQRYFGFESRADCLHFVEHVLAYMEEVWE